MPATRSQKREQRWKRFAKSHRAAAQTQATGRKTNVPQQRISDPNSICRHRLTLAIRSFQSNGTLPRVAARNTPDGRLGSGCRVAENDGKAPVALLFAMAASTNGVSSSGIRPIRPTIVSAEQRVPPLPQPGRYCRPSKLLKKSPREDTCAMNCEPPAARQFASEWAAAEPSPHAARVQSSSQVDVSSP